MFHREIIILKILIILRKNEVDPQRKADKCKTYLMGVSM